MSVDMAPPGCEGLEEWQAILDEALHGLHHALSNRIASLGALVELQQAGELIGDSPAMDTLSRDVHRLEEISRLVAALTREVNLGEEPLIISDVLTDALTIHRYLHATRELPVTIAPNPYVEPVRVERWALSRALVLLLREAKDRAKRAAGAVHVSLESDEQWATVRMRVQVQAPVEPAASGLYAETLAQRMGGSIERLPGAIDLRLPTLKSRRAAGR